jgi:hypothetical protein
VYFNAPVPPPQAQPEGQLYLRLNGTNTIEVSASQASEPDPHGGPFPAFFQFATPGGGAVFFTSAGSLTNDANTGTEPIAGNGAGRRNLYRYEVSSGGLTDLTVASGAENAAAGAGVTEVVAASTDGSVIYFTASGSLDSGRTTAGGTNLYVYHDGQIEFVAKGAPSGFESYSASPTGQYLAIESNARLTGFDNRSTGGAARDEVYLYSLQQSRLDCASCPNGAPTENATLPRQEGSGMLVEPVSSRGLVTDGGTVLFKSAEALLPGTANGQSKVYAWRNGRMTKISGGQSEGEDELLSESAGSADIFVRTYQQLVPADHDNALDIYDARVDGGFAEPPAVAECVQGSCRAEGGSGTGGSSAIGNGFSGSGFDGPPCSQLSRQAKEARKQSKRARKHGPAKKANRVAKKARRLEREAKACTRSGGAK